MSKIINSDALDALRKLPDSCCRTCITSPPYYGLRDYGADGQIGLEDTPDQYIENLVRIFREVRRVLKDDGTLWVNIGDSYTQKNLNGIPWLLAFALKADGWILRQDIIWHKPNAMPEQTTDRCTKSHEYIFLLSKQRRYYFDAAAIKEPAVGYGPDGTGRRRGNSASFRGGGAYTHDGRRITAPPWSGKVTGSHQTKAGKETAAAFGQSPPDHIRAHTSPHSRRNS